MVGSVFENAQNYFVWGGFSGTEMLYCGVEEAVDDETEVENDGYAF